MRFFIFPVLLGSVGLAAAAPTTPAKPAVPAKPALAKLQQINAGELRLDGKITAILGDGVWQLDAISWTSPRGVTTEFDDVKVKAVQLAPNASIHPLDRATKVLLKDIKLKSMVAVIGKNAPDGTVRVREVIVLDGGGDIKTVGTLSSNPISSGLIGQSRRARSAGQFEKALDLARKAAETASGMNDASGEALAMQDVALLYVELKQFPRALESFKRSQTLGERINNTMVQVLSLEGQGNVLGAAGQTDQALTLLERAVALSATASTTIQIGALSSLASVATRGKKRAQAVGALIRLFPLEEKANQFDEATGTLLTLAQLQSRTDAAAAKTYLDQARERMKDIRDEAARPGLILSLASALNLMGDKAGAAQQYEAAAKLAEDKGDTASATRIRELATKTQTEEDAPAPEDGAPPANPEEAPQNPLQ